MDKQEKRIPMIRRFKSIKSAILWSFSLLIVIALAIFMIIALDYTQTTVFENSVTYSRQIVRQVNNDIDSYIDYMENISTIMMENNDIQEYLFMEQNAAEEFESKQKIFDQIETIMNTRADIANIAVVTEDGKTIINNGSERLNPYIDVESVNWYQDTLRSNHKVNISSSHVQNLIRSSYDWVITLSRTFVNGENGKTEGLFFIDLNYESISDLCNESKIGERGYVYIIDEDGDIIYHPQQQLLYGGLREERIEEILESDKEYIITEERENSRLYTMSTSEKTGWTVVAVSYTDELLKNTAATQMTYILVAILLICAAIIISNMIARIISHPIGELRRAMSKVEQGQFEEAGIEVVDESEMGELSKSFNIMTNRIEDLMEQNVRDQKEKRKSELKALQSQINPHFLYNTLDSIIWMSAAGRNDEVVEMTSALSKLFRQSISNEKEQLTIREEIEYVKSYLIIQKMRYADKLDYHIDVEEQVMGIPIIKFALQPLVENAIYHGLKYKENGGRLDIKGYLNEDKVIIEVRDDGVGMTKEQLKYVFDEKQTDFKKNGVGVVNVLRRIQLTYGMEYGIKYYSVLGRGTTVVVTVPSEGGPNA